MEASRVLVVDDQREVRIVLRRRLEKVGFDFVEAEDGISGWETFQSAKPDLVVTDLRMPRADGISLLHRIRSVSSVPIIVLTAFGDVPTAVTAMKGGAQEFLSFPADVKRLVERAQQLTENEPSGVSAELESMVVGRSVGMRRLRERILGLAPLRVPVLVHGDEGSGRDHVVAALHRFGSPTDQPLLNVTAAEPRPPARGDQNIYLDGIEDFPPATQTYWAQRIRESGSESSGRFFASTALELEDLSGEGAFDRDLAEQLLRFSISVPPLRDRIEDIAELVPAIIARTSRHVGRENVRVTAGALAVLKSHPWPGNVAELAQTLERLAAFVPDGNITRRHVDDLLGAQSESVHGLRGRRTRKQREELVQLFEECDGNISEVARRLDLSRGAVTYRAQKYGLLRKRQPRNSK